MERWTALLDELERDVAGGGASDVVPWRPPENPGALPAALIDRARRLVKAQRDVIEKLEDECNSTRRHLAALRVLPQHRGETGPLYLDASG